MDLSSFGCLLSCCCCLSISLSCSSSVTNRLELLCPFFDLEPEMKTLILHLILCDPMPPNINNLMMFLDHLIQSLPFVNHLFLLVRLLHSRYHPTFFLLLLTLFDVCNCHETTSRRRVFTDPSLHLGNSVMDEYRLWLIADFFLKT